MNNIENKFFHGDFKSSFCQDQTYFKLNNDGVEPSYNYYSTLLLYFYRQEDFIKTKLSVTKIITRTRNLF